MCGICGSVERSGRAPQDVHQLLKGLAHRGYDSWGIAHVQNNVLELQKAVGETPEKLDLPQSHLAIGHTRWATHGGVTVENAHPHTDCSKRVAIVHNGIIENHQELKTELVGHNFLSQTDTEVFAHLLEQIIKETQLPFSLALREAFKRIEGKNAFLATDGVELAGIAKGYTLVLGYTPQRLLACSDQNELLAFTQKLYFAQDHEVVILNSKAEKIPPQKTEKKPIRFKSYPDRHYQDRGLGNFPHYMIKEITEQENILQKILESPDQITEIAKLIKGSRRLTFLGCGTASFAALTGEYLFAKYAGTIDLLVQAKSASEFSHFNQNLSPKDTVIAITQSGETMDLREQIDVAKNSGARVAAIVNAVGSSIYRDVDKKILLQAGSEKSVLATKSMTHMVSALLLLATEVGGNPEVGRNILEQSIKGVTEVLQNQDQIKQVAESLAQFEHTYILGSGLSYPVALEAALKIKEGSYIHAEAFAGAELKHGVIALVEKGTPVIVFAPNDQSRTDILSNAQEVKARGATIVGIGTQRDTVFDQFIQVPDTESSAIIPNLVTAQLLGYHLAIQRGVNPDKPRNLAKSVTVK